MNAKILLPLITEYVKDPALTESEVSDIVLIGKEMDVTAEAVRALVATERYRQHPSTSLEPIVLFYQLVVTLGYNGRLTKESTDFLHAHGQALGLSHTQASLLIRCYLEITQRSTLPDRLVYQLMQALAAPGMLTGELEAFVRSRAGQLGLSLEVYTALLHLAAEPNPTGSRRFRLYEELLQALVDEGSLLAPAREFALEVARTLGISEDIAFAMIDVVQQAGQENPQENIPLLDALVKGFVRRGLTSTEEREFLADQAYRLKIPIAGADALVRYELFIASRQAGPAEQQLQQVVHHLGLNGQATSGLSAYVTQLELELSQVKGVATYVQRVEEAIHAKRVARGEVRVSEREAPTQASFAAQETTPTQRLETPEPVVSGATEVTEGLNDHLIYKLDTEAFAFSKASLYSHGRGFTWYLLLKDAKSNRPTAKLLVLNGQEVDTTSLGDLTFSPNGLHSAYKQKQDASEVVVLNNRAGEPFDAVGALTFSLDETHFAYLAKKGRSWHVVLDGQLGPPSPALRDLHFNPATHRIAYVNYNKGAWQVVHDGLEDKVYSAVGGITFSPDGKHLVYWAKKGNQYFAIIDGNETAAFSGVGEFTFSKDSSQLAYMVNRDRLLAVVHNGRVSENYDIIRKLSFSSDGRNLGYMVKKNNREYTVVNGQPETIYDKVNGLMWSHVGTAYAYEATNGRDKMVVLNGHPGSKFEQISGITFSPVNESLAYAAYRDGAWYVVHDGQLSEPYSDVNELTFSPDGKYLTYFAKVKAEWQGVVRNGERLYAHPSPKYLCYSDDADQLAYLYFQGRHWHLVVNGQEVGKRPYENVLQGPQYDGRKGCFYLLAQAERDIRQVTFA